MVCEDFCFFNMHRAFHWPPLYKRIHKIHHQHKHPISIVAQYAHPVETIGNLLCMFIGPAFLQHRIHHYTMILWYCYRGAESVEGHCGYEFSWSMFRALPWSAGASYHNFHHLENVGNYSSFFTFWDTMFDTNKVWFN